jgi:hypothetical protein
VTEADAIRITRAHIESKFPKICTNCGERFETLSDYLAKTRHVGPPVSYDAEVDDWSPEKPLGTISLANCVCGSTMVIESAGMPLRTVARLMMWARAESSRRKISMRQLLEWLRSQIDDQVMRERLERH